MAEQHIVKMEVIGLDDPGPYLTIRQRCLCGKVISEHTVDVRTEPEDTADTQGATDAEIARAHLEAHGGGIAVGPTGSAFIVREANA